MSEVFSFAVTARDGAARRGKIVTRRGVIDTPAFMPVGTQGTVKAVTPGDLRTAGAQIILGNTYHLFLRPGVEVLEKFGGLHRFMHWDGPILTDSGGFQVFSLGPLRKVDDDGVTFQSHLDGSRHRLTPEIAVAIQRAIGSEIMMQLDECPAAGADRAAHEVAVRRSLDWAVRCRAALQPGDGELFGIAQGGTQLDLRQEHLARLAALDLPGYALGGLSVGEAPERTQEVLAAVTGEMPARKPRYLMGVGTAQDIIGAVSHGIDMFDCVLPTRNARNGMAFTFSGRVVIKHARHRCDTAPLEDGCDCETCAGYSRAYLRHLFMAGELLSHRLLTIHNLRFYQRLMTRLRAAIEAQTFAATARELLTGLSAEPVTPAEP